MYKANQVDNYTDEPPSYDHAVQASLEPENTVHLTGRFQDTSVDSYARAEVFIQAHQSMINRFPTELAAQAAKDGLIKRMSIDQAPHQNPYFCHPNSTPHTNPALKVDLDQSTVQVWPNQTRQKIIEDWDIIIQGTHPFLSLSDYGRPPQSTGFHYFEITVLDCAPNTVMAIGLATKPYPVFRMPGWNKHSIGYHSDDGRKFCDDASGGQDYGPQWGFGQTVGCRYDPVQGNVMFTLNGNPLGTAFQLLERRYYYPSFGADGPVKFFVNFGSQSFVHTPVDGNLWIGSILSV
ncbi:concanavalin A-like lectin/glucanase domain-containing protein [Phycomyces blakesleeanus]|uniref:Concanavalin A-like lectin/glucanase domain-containing protein n=1 Tax=Phycomyces blakesleeanus TaxID=4837 RepID=A0ABR3AKR1_PHYBL